MNNFKSIKRKKLVIGEIYTDVNFWKNGFTTVFQFVKHGKEADYFRPIVNNTYHVINDLAGFNGLVGFGGDSSFYIIPKRKFKKLVENNYIYSE